MVGIFDSGMGGEFALREFVSLCPNERAELFADRENAPYGTKSESELIRLVKRDIDILRSRGAERILMACCTASTVYPLLPSEYQRAVIPIIYPTALAALHTSRSKKICVISTEATARSGAFGKAILELCPRASVSTYALGELVTLVESGVRDGCVGDAEREIIKRNIAPVLDCDADTVILGCTHFAGLEGQIENISGKRTVNSARIGAMALAAALGEPKGFR